MSIEDEALKHMAHIEGWKIEDQFDYMNKVCNKQPFLVFTTIVQAWANAVKPEVFKLLKKRGLL